MSVIAVIPARGGSKGLPKKNIRLFSGKPLLAYMIEAALSASLVDRVFVSTDSEEIASVSQKYGAEVISRPEDLSNDTASSEAVLLHALEQLKINEKNLPDIILLLQCTAPFTTAEDINGTINALLNDNAESSLAAVPFYHFLWSNALGNAAGINHDGKKRQRRQDMEPQYLEAGSVYAMQVPAFLKERTRFCGKTSLYIIDDHHRCMEIDDAADFFQCESMHKWFSLSHTAREQYRQNKSQIPALPQKLGAIVCDFDGVFTDNTVYTLQNGDECVRCDRGDGAGISHLKELGVPVIVLSAEQNPVVTARCRKLGLECFQGITQKAEFLTEWLQNHQLSWENIIYIGNDNKDKECLCKAETGVIPYDAHKSVQNSANIILKSKGGHGALRELSDMVCEALNAGAITPISLSPGSNSYYAGQKNFRLWGTWEVLAVSSDYCIKKLCILPNKEISLQYHKYGDETWKIICGTGLVTLDNDSFSVNEKDVIQIKKEQLHRIKNISNCDLILIEIQTGDKLDETDIVRVSVNYNR